MSALFRFRSAICCALCFGYIGCAGTPGPGVQRPDKVLDFATLYEQNCAGCHGANGKNGAAISLSNPVYLAFAGEAAVRRVTANGVAGKLMPAFARSSGGSLTDPQVDSLVHGIFQTWGRPDVLAGSPVPPYAANEDPDAKGVKNGGQMFAEYCSRCHAAAAGSIVDSAYLALVSDQALRSTIVAGRPDVGMPDWRQNQPGSEAMTGQVITDIVAWLAARRTAHPGQPDLSRE